MTDTDNVPRPLELIIGQTSYSFCSASEFDFALKGRTTIPTKQLVHLIKYENLRNDSLKLYNAERIRMEKLVRIAGSKELSAQSMNMA